MTSLKLLSLSIFAMLSLSAAAEGYGVAGCGIGSVLWQDEQQTKFTNMVEASTNTATFTQMFGISSDTSNCIDAKTRYGSMQIEMYIEANRVALAKDISRGDGEALNTLAQIFRCQGEPVGPALRKKYDAIFPEANVSAAKVDQSIRTILRSEAQCRNLG